MKRYKDCALICKKGQHPIELLDIITHVSEEKGYKFYRYSTFIENDSLAVYIQQEKLPYSRLIICTNEQTGTANIVNIVPMPESSISHIECTVYNKLLNNFRDNVFVTIKKQHGNKIEENTENYSIEDIIPLSYTLLNKWLNNAPLSGHPLDMNRWYDFVISLHTNNEHLSLDDFEKYIKENYKWNEEIIDKFSCRLEYQIELLKYYDEHR